MKDATQTRKNGTANNAQRKRATATVQSAKRICGLDAQTKRPKRDSKGHTAVRTASNDADGFLRNSFAPKLKESDFIQSCTDSKQIERDFYKSLSIIENRYQLHLKPTQSLGFPFNVSIALTEVREQLKANVADWKEIRLIEDSGSLFFAKEVSFNTCSTLYYIPVVPLYYMLHDKKRKKTAQLLLSVCTYLYQIADIPYYRQEHCYLNSMYEMLVGWESENDSDEEIEHDTAFLKEYRQSMCIGDIMEIKIQNPKNLEHFKNRLLRMSCTDALDKQSKELAHKFFTLLEQYPNTPIHRKFKSHDLEDYEDADHYNVTLDKYVSFCGSTEGILSDNLIEMVNTDLQESNYIDEPINYELFDNGKLEDNDFDFESRLFTLMEELITVLNDYKI